MAENRLTGSDKRTLVLWVLLGIVGAVFAQKYFFQAFPEASVDFKVSRAEAVSRAQQFVGSLGADVSGYQSAIVFDVDDNAKTYLEREVGLKQANQMMSGELNIWYWDVRFFRPQQEQEFHVRVSPAGEVVGYEHKIEEAKAGASLDRAAAQSAAENFLRGKMGNDLSQWDFLSEEANSSKKPNRLDWSFTWEKRGFKAKDAPYRLRVTLQGEQAGSSEEFLHVPEAWERDFTTLRSKNNLYSEVAIIPYLALLVSVIGLGILLTIRKQTSWGGAIKLGIVVAILLTFMQLNNWPLERMSYDTNTSYGTFVVRQIENALLFGIVSALTVALVIPGAEPLYRASQPGRLRLSKALTLRGLRSKEFFTSAIVGLSMAAAHIGFIVAFYIVAGHFGAWAPQELNYENSVNTTFPWISGVAIGLLAATSEEFLFRLFAIPFLQRFTRSRIIAVIVPAFCWSFLHSAYPNEPPYIRGLEVGLIGIVAGIVMLRWGILATLIWHYTVDASLVGLLLVRSNSLYFKISGLIVGLAALAPLIFASVSYLTRGRFEPDEDLLNSAEPEKAVVAEAAQTSPETTGSESEAGRYDALSSGVLAFLAVCLVLGAAAAWRLKTPAVGDYLKMSVDGKTALARANEVLGQRGLNAGDFHHVTVLVEVTDPVTNEFLRRRIGVEGLNAIYAKQVPGVLWRVRYFQDGQAEEYAVILKPDGSLHSLHHTLREDAQGAALSKDEAVAIAEKYLRDEKKIDLSGWSLVDSSSDKRPHRIDHMLTWQQNAALDEANAAKADSGDHAYARIELYVLGNEPANYRTYIKIPDEWRRKQEEQTLPRTIYGTAVSLLLFLGLGIAVLVLFFKNLRSEAMRAIPWRKLMFRSLWGLFAYILIVVFGNRIQMLLSNYQTAVPYKATLAGVAIAIIVGAFLYVGGLSALFGFGTFFGSRAFGLERLPVGRRMPGAYYRDAFCLGLCGTAGFVGVQRAVQFFVAQWQTPHRSEAFSAGSYLDSQLPAGATFGHALIGSLFLAGLIALLAGFVVDALKPLWLRVGLFFLGVLFFAGSDWGNGADFAKEFIASLILLGVLVFGVGKIIRFNVLGCMLIVGLLTLLGAASELLGQPNAFYRANGYGVVAMIVLLLAWPLALWKTRPAVVS